MAKINTNNSFIIIVLLIIVLIIWYYSQNFESIYTNNNSSEWGGMIKGTIPDSNTIKNDLFDNISSEDASTFGKYITLLQQINAALIELNTVIIYQPTSNNNINNTMNEITENNNKFILNINNLKDYITQIQNIYNQIQQIIVKQPTNITILQSYITTLQTNTNVLKQVIDKNEKLVDLFQLLNTLQLFLTENLNFINSIQKNQVQNSQSTNPPKIEKFFIDQTPNPQPMNFNTINQTPNPQPMNFNTINQTLNPQPMNFNTINQTQNLQYTTPPEVNSELLNKLRQKNTSSENLTNVIPTGNSLSVIGKNKILNLKNTNDINNLMVGGSFRLKVNLPMLPPYIMDEEYNMKDGKNPNYFYLCIAKLDPNCNIVAINGTCLNLYIDNKNCKNKKLSITSQSSPYRLILISEKYANATNLPFIDNLDFTLVNINNNLYIKNVATDYYPNLFRDNLDINVYGNMVNDELSNVSKIPNLTNNNVCNEYSPPVDLQASSLYVNCLIKPDDQMYLMTTTDITQSSPLDIKINNDSTINLSLKTYTTYGFVDTSYSLIFGDFDIITYKDIEKITIPNVGTFFINMLCFDSNTDGILANSNKLNFIVESISLPPNFIKDTSII
jgi:hypothetical protein